MAINEKTVNGDEGCGEVLTAEEISEKYTVKELQNILRKNSLNVSGKKQELVERVLPVLKDIEAKKQKKLINDLKGEIKDLKDQNERLNGEISKFKSENFTYKIKINDLNGEIKDLKDQNERLIGESSKGKSENFMYKSKIDEANFKLSENKKLINTLYLKIRNDASAFEKFKKNYGVVIYNVWRMGRTIENDYKFNKQNFESITNLIDLFGKNLENKDIGFEDNKLDFEFIENQKLFINDSLRSLEKSYKQYQRVLILLEKSGIRIEEYNDIKDEDKLNVTKLDVIESSEVQEILVETVKPSIYCIEKKNSKDNGTEKRIFEGEIILTKPKE